MTPPAGSRIVDDSGELVQYFSDAVGAHVYALVDLEEPYWSASTWYRRGDAVVGLVGLPGQGLLAVYAVSTRDPEGALDLVAELCVDLPAGQLVTAPVGLGERLTGVRATLWAERQVRYELVDPDAALAVETGVVRFGPNDVDRLSAMYATEPGAAFFLPFMLDDDSFVGVVEGDRVVAAAGTHVLSETAGVAAIGSVYTLPSHRGQGLGRRVTAGVVQTIADRVEVIGLNVAADNVAARRIYERLGFRPILDYDEAQLA